MAEIYRSRFRSDPYGDKDAPEGSDYRIFIGPQHPWAEEPAHFIIHLKGERVVEADIRIGFNLRGMEKAMEAKTWRQNTMLVPRACGICSAVHQNVYVRLAERLAGVEDKISERARLIRMFSLEAERVHSHILWYGILAHDAGFDTMLHVTWRDREMIMDIVEDISGNRVNPALMVIGGVKRDIPQEKIDRTRPLLDKLTKQVEYHKKVFTEEASIRNRLENVGVLTKEDAKKITPNGPTARGSGIPFDVRKSYPYELYDDIDWKPIYYSEGDILATTLVRLDETLESLNILKQILDRLETASGELMQRVKTKFPEGQYMARAEAPRGEDIHFGVANGTDKPERYKIRAPSLGNIDATLKRMDGEYIADMPVILRSYDPCFSCTNRIMIINENTGEKMLLHQDEFARKAIKAKKYNRPFF
ncbi:MAG: hydrogenase large subunit [Candidatus Heimdallarchaeaceae archaeon]